MKLNFINFYNNSLKDCKFEKRPHFAVAVSGGPDSMALINLLTKYANRTKATITPLIVNHGLRKNSLKEAKWVSSELKEKNLIPKILNVNKNKIKRRNMSEARTNRFNKLLKYCKDNNILYLFLAHHHDDDIETFINRKLLGSDFEGLQSINKNTIIDKIKILRPFLIFTKDQIYKYNKMENIKFVEDPSNYDHSYTRPIIREFIKNNKNYKKNIYNEFNYIKKNIPLYKTMVWQIFNKNMVSTNKNKLLMNYDFIIENDDLVIEKILNYIYKFFNSYKKYLRSQKILVFIDHVRKPNFNTFNLGGLKVSKKERLLIFYKNFN